VNGIGQKEHNMPQMNNHEAIGKTVHFKEAANKPCVAAIITAVNEDGTVSLTLFGPFHDKSWFARVKSAIENDPLSNMVGTWHWPSDPEV
jgi:hypothetical protein